LARRAAKAAIVWASVFLVLPGAAAEAAASRKLSNESTLSRWAYANYPSRVRIAPRSSARSFTHLHYLTEDDQLEIYLALRSRVDQRGDSWVQIRLPMRPNGLKGWVRSSALGRFHVVRTLLVINRTTLRATLYRRGVKIWRAPVGVGRPSLPTPGGHFWAREKLRSLDSFYGPIAIGTSAYSSLTDWPGGGVVGIHGTSLPGLIPGRPSHGCVRLRNPDIVRLAHLMPLGSPIWIR
jgi:hypothetical protein